MFSPSAIADFLACKHLVALNRAASKGQLKKPYFADPMLELLKKLGTAHEEKYLRQLADEGRTVVSVPDGLGREEASRRTVEAMKAGAEVIYQASFLTRAEESDNEGVNTHTRTTNRPKHHTKQIEDNGGSSLGESDKLKHIGHYYGRADFLVKVGMGSGLGEWSYEVVETKLARSTKARAIVQLCFYSELLAQIQGLMPVYMHVVLGGNAQPEKFAVQRYLAYFRKVKREFVAAFDAADETYPEPVEHCGICDWSTVCDECWRKDDHLSIVAGITRNQREALLKAGVSTVVALGRLRLSSDDGPAVEQELENAATTKIEGIKGPALFSIREQARLQVQGREEKRYLHKLLEPPEAEKGLCALPAPSEGDVFLDFEGDGFVVDGGLEYLFGVLSGTEVLSGKNSKRGDAEDAETLSYQATWAMNRAEEKRAFESFIAQVMERQRRFPDMHIYHYGAYEETAIKRMAGVHSTCVDEVDELLRGEVLVDMYRVVKQGLRASVESYSIKKLEPLYNYKRDVKLIDANVALHAFQTVLAFGGGDEGIDEITRAIEGYNRDDCVSAMRLREWLEQLRITLEQKTGQPLPRPSAKATEPDEDLAEYLQRVRQVEQQLLANLPEDENDWNEEERARWLMAQLLEWHRREDKSAWWNYFRLCDLSDQELIEDKSALGGLVYAGEVEKVKKSIVHRYRFPQQDYAINRAMTLHDPRTKNPAGEFYRIDQANRTIDLKRGLNSTVPHPTALIPYEIFQTKVQRESLLQLGSWIAGNGMEVSEAGRGPAGTPAVPVLLRRPPRLREGVLEEVVARHGNGVDAAREVALLLDHSVLPIQGPPGSGKTYTGARMIVELVRNKKKVGITAVSHKVISKLLKEVCDAAHAAGVELKAIQKVDSDDGCIDDKVRRAKDNDDVQSALANDEVQVAAGTGWLWSRDDMTNAVHSLFVDEAGQMSLANVLAAAKSTTNIILLGDPQQLDQPQRGVHPPGAEASALAHLLNGKPTISTDRGLFLAESWRLPPDICAFTSDVFYEGRLAARAENELQRLVNVTVKRKDAENAETRSIDGSGLRYVPVRHSANQSESPEEVDVVARLVDSLLTNRATWTNKRGEEKVLTLADILIVAPYNAQVSLLLQRLPRGARVGTVDKFQGQEAPVVFYSMTTSTAEDAPRGMEFLYSANRLNVASSRAQCLTVLVASPDLFEVQCKTPRQMELANAFCRYLEIAQLVHV
jgi:uncharacterized protein